MEMEHIIPASEFTRNFGRYQMIAQREPVAVTSHGRTTGYFIAAEDYEAFKRFKESRGSFATAELSEEKAQAISAARMDERHNHLDSMLDQ
jgi:PHD/YefM family antitoxin component YafN of YafNO toxin-antitoxin module